MVKYEFHKHLIDTVLMITRIHTCTHIHSTYSLWVCCVFVFSHNVVVIRCIDATSFSGVEQTAAASIERQLIEVLKYTFVGKICDFHNCIIHTNIIY